MIRKLANLFNTKNKITHSDITAVFTRFGRYKIKAYSDDKEEYLAIMSENFFNLDEPIVYIHSDAHTCFSNSDETYFFTNKMEVALKMIHKFGGLIIYYSGEERSIDGLLQELNTRKLESDKNVIYTNNINLDERLEIVYPSMAFMLQDLKLSNIKLISNNFNIIHDIKQLGIRIIKHETSVSFKYGR